MYLLRVPGLYCAAIVSILSFLHGLGVSLSVKSAVLCKTHPGRVLAPPLLPMRLSALQLARLRQQRFVDPTAAQAHLDRITEVEAARNQIEAVVTRLQGEQAAARAIAARAQVCHTNSSLELW